MKKNYPSVLFTLFLCSLFAFTGCSKKTLKVGFYNVSAAVQQAVENSIKQSGGEKAVFQTIESITDESAEKLAKKYDLVIANNGEGVSKLVPYALDFDESLRSRFPDSVVKNQSKALPLLLNHYGISYSTAVKAKAKIRYPGNFQEFEKYLDRLSSVTDIPLYVVGADDLSFMAFLSCFFEGYAGTEGYYDFIKALESYPDFTAVLQATVGQNETVASVLQVLKFWAEKQYLPKSWTDCNYSDLVAYLKKDQVGTTFISLDQYREVTNLISAKLVCDRFPVKNTEVSHSIICPSVVCLNLSKKDFAKTIQSGLVSPEVQKELSKQTALAPAENTAQPYDKQASDVRFLAAACINGPVPSVADVLYESSPEKLHELCQEFRNYLRS